MNSLIRRASVRSLLRQSSQIKSNLSTAASTHDFPPYLLATPPTSITSFPSSLRVATERILGSNTATVGVWIDAGSRYETSHNNGAAHFLEHMAFKGTQRRTQYMLEVEIENMGGHLNAYTSREQTVYFAKVFERDVPRAMDILADILLNSNLDRGSIQRERDVILREMKEVNKNPEELTLDHLHATAFATSGLGRTILGPEENIKKLSREDLREYIDTHYLAPQMVIAGAGAVDHNELCDLANYYFGGLKTELNEEEKKSDAVCLDEAKFVGSDVRFHFPSDTMAHISLAYEGASWTSEYAYPLMILQNLLGSYNRAAPKADLSKLCHNVAMGELANSVSTFNTCYKDTGLFGLYSVVESDKVNDLITCVTQNLAEVAHHITEEDVERSKTTLKATMLMGLDGNTNVCEDIGRQLLTYGRRMTPAEIFTRIEEMTADDVRAAAHMVFHNKDHAMAAVGGLEGLPSYEWIRSHSF